MSYRILLRSGPALVLALLLLVLGSARAQGGNLTYGQTVVGSLSAQSPLAFYTFNGNEGDLITIHVIALSAEIDAAVSLNSPTQQQLANSDNDTLNPGTGDARLSYRLPQNGVYTILVSSATGAAGDFVVRLSGRPPAEAAELSLAAPTELTISPDLPPLVYSVSVAEPSILSITSQTPDFTFTAEVRDEQGQVVALLGGDSVSLGLNPGTTYEITVFPVNPSLEGIVSLSISGVGQPAAPAATPEVGPDPLAGVAADAACTVTPLGNAANLRTGPGTIYAVGGTLAAGQTANPDGQATGPDGFVWWHLPGDNWVRSDVVRTAGACDTLPVVATPPPPVAPAETDEVQPPTATPTATDETQPGQATATPTATATVTPSYTPTTPPPPPTAPPDANYTLTIPLDSTASVTDFVSYPGGDQEDRVSWDISGMNPNSSLSGGRARLILAVSCFGTGTQNVQFFTGGQTYACGQTIVDREVTYDSRTGSVLITAVAGENTYVQWVVTGTATRVN